MEIRAFTIIILVIQSKKLKRKKIMKKILYRKS